MSEPLWINPSDILKKYLIDPQDANKEENEKQEKEEI